MHEIWRDVVGYEGIYKVSNLGRVISLRKPKTKKPYPGNGRILKAQLDGKKYPFIALWRDGKPAQLRIHALVLEAFVGARPKGYYANHINGIRDDNRLQNLEWCTPSENNLHAYRILGRSVVSRPGELNPAAKLTSEQIDQIRALRKIDPRKWTLRRIGEKFGIVKSHVKRIIDGASWKC